MSTSVGSALGLGLGVVDPLELPRNDDRGRSGLHQLEDAFLNYEEALGESFEEYLPISLAEEDGE